MYQVYKVSQNYWLYPIATGQLQSIQTGTETAWIHSTKFQRELFQILS